MRSECSCTLRMGNRPVFERLFETKKSCNAEKIQDLKNNFLCSTTEFESRCRLLCFSLKFISFLDKCAVHSPLNSLFTYAGLGLIICFESLKFICGVIRKLKNLTINLNSCCKKDDN